MINFDGHYMLEPTKSKSVTDPFKPLLLEDEKLIAAFRGIRDSILFTDKRIITRNAQGLTGKKTDFTTLPYNRIQAFAVETSAGLDMDCDLEFYIASIGKIKFSINGDFDVVSFGKTLSGFIL